MPTRAAGVGGAALNRGGTVGPDNHRAPGSGGSCLPCERQRTVVLVDERQLMLEALAALIGSNGMFAVTTCAPDDGAPAAIASIDPDLVLVGTGQRHEQSLRLLEPLRRLVPQIRMVIVADSQDPELIRCVLDQSVAALVLTTVTGDDLAFMLDQVVRGNAVLPTGWQSVLEECAHNPIAGLSERQLEVLRLLADGCSYEEISLRLVITVNTVKFHVRSIYMHLGVSNRMAAVRALEASPAACTTHPVSQVVANLNG